MSSLTRPGLSRILHGVFLASMAIGFFAALVVPTPLSAQVPDPPTPTTAPPPTPPPTTAPPPTAAPTTDPPETTVAPATTAAPTATTATTKKPAVTSSTASTVLQTTTTPDQLPTLPPLPNANQPSATVTTAAFDSDDDDARVSPLFPALSIGGFIVALLILVIQFLLSSRRN